MVATAVEESESGSRRGAGMQVQNKAAGFVKKMKFNQSQKLGAKQREVCFLSFETKDKQSGHEIEKEPSSKMRGKV